MEFDQFMKIEGCATGVHSLEKRAVAPAPQPKTEKSSVGVNGMMPSSDEKKTDTSAPKPAHQTTRDVFQPMKPNEIKSQSSPPKPEPEDDPESIVPEGSKCKRLACGITWSGMGNCKRGKLDKDECTYHPGTVCFSIPHQHFSYFSFRVQFSPFPLPCYDSHVFSNRYSYDQSRFFTKVQKVIHVANAECWILMIF
jgi:hypothetical protein